MRYNFRAPQELGGEEKAVSLAITDIETRLRRWEEALERGLLPLEDAAHRITDLRQERASLLKTKAALERSSGSATKIHPIPTSLINTYVKEMQERLRTKKIGHKKGVPQRNTEGSKGKPKRGDINL